jgi:pimeloyl-ACP methyl ester carboxylesterase
MDLELLSRGAPSERPPLLFVHGAFHSAGCWDHHYLPWFAERGWHAHALSLRGHGKSPGNAAADNPGLDDYVEDIGTVMDAIGGPCVLVGHSMGGVLVQRARARDERAAGAVLLASSPLKPAPGVLFKIFLASPISFLKAQFGGDMAAMKQAFIPTFYSKALPKAQRERYIAELSDESGVALGELFSRGAPETPDTDRRPVLVVGGRDDWAIPLAEHEALASAFAAPVEICPGGHDLMLDPEWEASAQAIENWLQSTFCR